MPSKPGSRYNTKGKITDTEKMAIKALSATGMSNRSIVKKTGRSLGAVGYIIKNASYQELQESYETQAMQNMIQQIEKNELNDLALLGSKARRNLHTLADEGKMRPIENIALMDRSFQQKRLLQGKSTSNINSLAYLITKAAEEREKRMGVNITINNMGGEKQNGPQKGSSEAGSNKETQGVDKWQGHEVEEKKGEESI